MRLGFEIAEARGSISKIFDRTGREIRHGGRYLLDEKFYWHP
jgi:hypothetical protein